jgi:anaerobic ribonucleoside-triphosphate reductase
MDMSELKALWIPTRSGNSLHCYIKYEADKVIAEKDKEIARQNTEIKNAVIDLTLRDKKNDELAIALKHQKYKRCLAMANYWVAVSYQCVDDKHRQSAERHHRKWLELAKKFKEWK